MEANFKIENDLELSKFDKCLIVLNWNTLGVVQNLGSIKKKSKIEKTKNVVGIWRIKKSKK